MEWKDIYTLPRQVTINTNLRIFQYKLLHIILCLTKRYTNLEKTYPHFAFFAWKNLKALFTLFILAQKQTFSGCSYILSKIVPPITPQSAIFGFIDHKVNYHLINQILLIFKYYVYKTRENGSLDLKLWKRNIFKIKNIEKQISLNKPKKQKQF